MTEALGIEIGGEGRGGMSEQGLGLGGFGGGIGRGRGAKGTGRGRGATKAKSIGSKRVRSKARPARLIYPKRFRKERPGGVFVVVLTVDPALDRDGRPIKSRVVQRFMVD